MNNDTTPNVHSLEELATLYGIHTHYWSIDGNRYDAQPASLQKILHSMRVAHVDDPPRALHDYQLTYWQTWVEPVQVVRRDDLHQHGLHVQLRLPAWLCQEVLSWELRTEQGQKTNGMLCPADLECLAVCHLDAQTYHKLVFNVPLPDPDLELGYHRLTFTEPAQGNHATVEVMVTPSTCYVPPAFHEGKRFWGPAVQLYSLSSQRDWGIGDFSCLKTLASWAASEQAALVGLSPMNVLNLQRPEVASPYSPSDRMFLNPLYIDVEAASDFPLWHSTTSAEQRQWLHEQRTGLRQRHTVDYTGVARLKLHILEGLYHQFQMHHLQPETERGKAFRNFVERAGENLGQFSMFLAIQEAQKGADWQQWPEAYHKAQQLPHPLLLSLEERAGFFRYLQWLAHEQLHDIMHQRERMPLPIGLYLDFPVGANPGGFDVWRHQDLYALSASVGAPPDPLGPKGQNWGFPPLIPHRLRQAAYKPLIETMRQTMQYAGALRLDHVAGLNRLFWIAADETAANGVYVQYNFDEILGIIALESHRNHCLIVGEDLGTLPDIVRQRMQQWRLLSYKVVRWERDWHADASPYLQPQQYPRFSVVAPSTHDTPTLAGMLIGTFYDVLRELELIDDAEVAQAKARSDDDNRALIARLIQEGLLPPDFDLETLKSSVNRLPRDTFQVFCDAVHRFTARTQSALALFTIEDTLGEVLQVNIPGTADADQPAARTKMYPNWRKRSQVVVEAFADHPQFQRVVEAFRQERH
jgi:(1->4)-alpha-D-glucan 1-alpha-D-glucosylmutase